jgi:predicted DNA-binding transcriptional regulator
LSRDQTYGVVILLVSVAVFLLYTWLLYAYPLLILQITAFITVAAVLVILGWIGWTMATTPPPAPFQLEPVTEEATTAESQKVNTNK